MLKFNKKDNIKMQMMQIKIMQSKIDNLNSIIKDLEDENKKIKENFISRYKYVITGEEVGLSTCIHLYIDGANIPIRNEINFSGSRDGVDIEIHN